MNELKFIVEVPGLIESIEKLAAAMNARTEVLSNLPAKTEPAADAPQKRTRKKVTEEQEQTAQPEPVSEVVQKTEPTPEPEEPEKSIQPEQVSEDVRKKESIPAEPVKVIKLEDVRSILAGLARNGKADQVKEILVKFGATKLTDVPAEKYQAILDEVEGLK